MVLCERDIDGQAEATESNAEAIWINNKKDKTDMGVTEIAKIKQFNENCRQIISQTDVFLPVSLQLCFLSETTMFLKK